MRHHHHQVRVASEGRRVVAPRLTARLQRSPIGPTTNMIMNALLVAKYRLGKLPFLPRDAMHPRY